MHRDTAGQEFGAALSMRLRSIDHPAWLVGVQDKAVPITIDAATTTSVTPESSRAFCRAGVRWMGTVLRPLSRTRGFSASFTT